MDKAHASLLARTVWLSQTPEEFQHVVISACQIRELSTGQWLYAAEDDCGGPFAVLEGAMAMEAPSDAGTSDVVWVVQPGHWFGVASVLAERARMVNMRAISDSTLAMLPASAARRIATNSPEAWRWFGLMAARNGDRAVTMAVSLMIPDKATRIASILSLLAESGFVDSARVPIPLARSELARICGLSRGPMSLQLDLLEGRGEIRTGYRRIEVLDDVSLRSPVPSDKPR